MTIEHPAKVDAPVDPLSESRDFLIVAKALAHSENARQQQCRIYRRDFAVPTALACLRIEPVIEPTALVKRASVEEPQRFACAFECCGFVDPIPVDGDADSSQTKTSGSNARNVLMTRRQRRAIHARAIRYESCLRIGLFPKVTKRTLLEIREECFMFLLRAECERSKDDDDEERSA